MEQSKKQWKGRTGGGQFGQWFLLTSLARIPVRFFYPILYLVIPFYLLFGFKSSRLTFAYFHQRQGFSWWRSLGMVFRNYICFGKIVLDKFAVAAGKSDQFEIKLIGEEYISQSLQSDKGFIMASAHVGNFELAGHCLSQNQKQIYGIIYGGESKGYIQKRQESFKQTHVTLIPVADDMSHLFVIKDALDNGHIVSLLCDRLFGSPKQLTLPFLNGEASFPLGMFYIAAQLDVSVLTVFVLKETNRCYRIFVEPLSWSEDCKNSKQRAASLCSQYVAKLEHITKQYPLQWFNYYNFWKE